MSMSSKSCWIVVEDGLTGTENQCVGVAEALGVSYEIKHINYSDPWIALPQCLRPDYSRIYSPQFDAPYPDLVIAGGRKSTSASCYIKDKSKGSTFTVQLMDPYINPENFDLVAVPQHDKLRGDNVIVTLGAPNLITEEQLNKARLSFAHIFESMPTPRIAVAIGGRSGTYTLKDKRLKKIIEKLKSLPGSLMITTSRRTGEENTQLLKDALDNDENYFWNGQSPNPYLGMLAWANHILVTEDSVSMICEAATTGKPVQTIQMDKGLQVSLGDTKFLRFHNYIRKKGIAKPFTGNLEHWTYEPLNDAQKVADAIENAMK
ncbi:MAG: mitochondrial fission ELM1 family protein [Pseudomonadota bacterium]